MAARPVPLAGSGPGAPAAAAGTHPPPHAAPQGHTKAQAEEARVAYSPHSDSDVGPIRLEDAPADAGAVPRLRTDGRGGEGEGGGPGADTHPSSAVAGVSLPPTVSPTGSDDHLSPVPLEDLGTAFPVGSLRPLLITVALRNLSSNSSVVALFEAKDETRTATAGDDEEAATDVAPPSRILAYVGHTEGIRHSHNPNFQTPLCIDHKQGSQQRIKFNVYTLPSGDTRVDEAQRLGSAYVSLDEIAAHLDEDLFIELRHGHNAEKDRNNQCLRTHMLLRARVAPSPLDEDQTAAGLERAAALKAITAGRVLTLLSARPGVPSKQAFFFYRHDGELGALHWLDLSECDRLEVKERKQNNNSSDHNPITPTPVRAPATASQSNSIRYQIFPQHGHAHYSVPTSYNADAAVAERRPNVLRLVDIVAINEGQQTPAFKNLAAAAAAAATANAAAAGAGSLAPIAGADPPPSLPPSDCCFSILMQGGVTVDLVCHDASERQAFMLSIHAILSQQAAREHARANQYRFRVRLRNLPPSLVREGGLFVSASSRASSGTEFEVVSKTGWMAARATPLDFPRSMRATFVHAEQVIQLSLFHNSLHADGKVAQTPLIAFKDIQDKVQAALQVASAHAAATGDKKNSLILATVNMVIPLRHMADAERDRALQDAGASVHLECAMDRDAAMLTAQLAERKAARKRARTLAAASAAAAPAVDPLVHVAVVGGSGGMDGFTDDDEDEESSSDELAEDDSSGSASDDETYMGAKLARLRKQHRDVMGQGSAHGGGPHLQGGRIELDDALLSLMSALPPVPSMPPAPKVSSTLFAGVFVDKYAFSSKGCSRRLVFAARDLEIKEDKKQHAVAVALPSSKEDKNDAAASSSATVSRSGRSNSHIGDALRVDTLLSPRPLDVSGDGAVAGRGPFTPAAPPFSSRAQSVAVSGAGIPGLERAPERMRLYWSKPSDKMGKLDSLREHASSLKLSEISDVLLGKASATFHRKDATDVPDACAFSICYGHRTLDLAADSPDVRDALVSDLIHFLLPRSKQWKAYGQAGTGANADAWEAYDKAMAAHNAATRRLQNEVAQRLHLAQMQVDAAWEETQLLSQNAASAVPAGTDAFSQLSSDASAGGAAPMPDLQAAMALLSKLHARGLQKLGINPSGLALGKKEQPDLVASLAALEDIFAELDDRFGELVLQPNGTLSRRGSVQSTPSGRGVAGGANEQAGSSSSQQEGGRGARRRSGMFSNVSSPRHEDEQRALESGILTRQREAECLTQLSALAADDDADEALLAEVEAHLLNAMQQPSRADGADSGGSDAIDENGVPIAPPAPDANMVVGAGAPPPPPGPPGMGGPPKIRRLKQLHWDPLHSHEVASTVFQGLQSTRNLRAPSAAPRNTDDDVKVAEEEVTSPAEDDIDALFANKQGKKLDLKSKEAGTKKQTIIESKRAYNIEIGLTRLKSSAEELKREVLRMDPAVLTEERAQILFDRAPTLEEMVQLQQAAVKMPLEQMGVVERFLLVMASIPQCALRLELHLFMLRFEAQAAELKERLHTLFAACRCISGSTRLRAVLEVVLQVGNYLNEGSSKGNAAGFKLSALTALSNTRSVNNRSTLLDFIARHIDRTLKTPLEREQRVPFLVDIGSLTEAVNLDFANVELEQRRMAMQLKKIEAQLAAPPDANGGSEDQFHARLAAFYPQAAETCRLLSSRLKRVLQLESSLLAYFGESSDKMTLSAMFSIFSTFTIAFQQAEQRIKRQPPSDAPAAASKQNAGQSSKGTVGSSRAKVNDVLSPLASTQRLLPGDPIDPRLSASFSTQLQEAKLRPRRATYLTGSYSGLKTEAGQTIAPATEEHRGPERAAGERAVHRARISISLGNGSVVGGGGSRQKHTVEENPLSPDAPLAQTPRSTSSLRQRRESLSHVASQLVASSPRLHPYGLGSPRSVGFPPPSSLTPRGALSLGVSKSTGSSGLFSTPQAGGIGTPRSGALTQRIPIARTPQHSPSQKANDSPQQQNKQ